jgi:hypothetical protein
MRYRPSPICAFHGTIDLAGGSGWGCEMLISLALSQTLGFLGFCGLKNADLVHRMGAEIKAKKLRFQRCRI